MEKVLRCVGNAFLVAVNAFGEIENVIHASTYTTLPLTITLKNKFTLS